MTKNDTAALVTLAFEYHQLAKQCQRIGARLAELARAGYADCNRTRDTTRRPIVTDLEEHNEETKNESQLAF